MRSKCWKVNISHLTYIWWWCLLFRMFSSFCTIKVESVSELQRTKLLPTLDTMIPSCLVEPGLCKAFNYSLKERRGERQAALCKPFNFLCQKPVVFIVGAGNVTRKSWDFGRFSFFFFLDHQNPRLMMTDVQKISSFGTKLWNLVLSHLRGPYSQLF